MQQHGTAPQAVALAPVALSACMHKPEGQNQRSRNYLSESSETEYGVGIDSGEQERQQCESKREAAV